LQIKSNEKILGGGGITSDKDESLFSKAWTTIRESIASALAILIIAVTLYFLWPALTAKPVAIDDAQAIFSILGGWGGVVLGYYFGRLPAEKAADKADAAAEKARAQRNSS
jgi:multidrug transporter EmrE-like cation transporter